MAEALGVRQLKGTTLGKDVVLWCLTVRSQGRDLRMGIE